MHPHIDQVDTDTALTELDRPRVLLVSDSDSVRHDLQVRRIEAIAVFAALCAFLAACTSAPGPTRSSGPTTTGPSTPGTTPVTTSSAPPSTPASTAPATPTVPADVPTTGPNTKPGERPPVMPIAATKHTAAGAQAFAKFFLQTIDWGYATTSSTYMKRYYQPTCKECRNTALLLDNAMRMGNHYIGSRLILTKIGRASKGGPRDAEYSIRFTMNISAVEVVDQAGKASHPDPAHIRFSELVCTKWQRGRWSAVWIHGQDP